MYRTTLLPKIASHMPDLPPLEACCDGCYTLNALHTVEAYPVSLDEDGQVLPASKKTLCGACSVGHDFPVKRRYSKGSADYVFGTVVEYSEDDAAPFRMSFLDSDEDIWTSLPRKPTLAYLAHANSFNHEKDERAFHPSLLDDSSESGVDDEVSGLPLDDFPLFNDDRIIDLNAEALLSEEEPIVDQAVPRKDVNKNQRSSTRTRSSSRKKNQASLARSKSQASTRAQPKKNGRRMKRRSGGGRKTRCPVLWTEEEDGCLKQAVAKCSKDGPVRWPDVAQLPGLSGRRTGKQCRERFINHLCSSLKKKDEWSPHEDFSIVSLLFRMGTKWSVITPFIPGRTDNGIKNRFHNIRRRQEKVVEAKYQEYTNLLVLSDDDSDSDDETDLVATMKANVRKLSKVIALESKGNRPSKSKEFPFGPFLSCTKEQKQCKRCHLFLPSAQTGTLICKKTGWCVACTLVPFYVVHDQLRLCLNMRQP